MTIDIVERGLAGHRRGPDCYVAILIVPDGVAAPRAMQRTTLERRGCRLVEVGRGYTRATGPRSALGRVRCVAAAVVVAARQYLTRWPEATVDEMSGWVRTEVWRQYGS